MLRKAFIASTLLIALSAPAFAVDIEQVTETDSGPTIGFGLNFTFGGGKVNPGIGIRALSNNEDDSAAASVGLDYMLKTKSWRGSVGVAYIMDGGYIELNSGYDFGANAFDFGAGFGGITTQATTTTTSSYTPEP